MRTFKLVGLGATMLVASLATANAQSRLQVGVLECQGGPNVSFVIGSKTTLNCEFRSQGRRPEPYTALVSRMGLDLGFTQQTGFAWAVYAPTRQIGPGDLSGHYGGVGANASVGVGFGGNLLVGGSANSFSLQPLSVQGQTGVNITAGIADVDLRPAGLVQGPRKYRKHYRHHHRHHHG